MKYFLYRIKYDDYLKLNNLDNIKCDLEIIHPSNGDLAIMIVSKSLLVLGAYKYNEMDNRWILMQKISRPVTDFYEKLPMIQFVNERTYKIFAKRLREIDRANYDPFLVDYNIEKDDKEIVEGGI